MMCNRVDIQKSPRMFFNVFRDIDLAMKELEMMEEQARVMKDMKEWVKALQKFYEETIVELETPYDIVMEELEKVDGYSMIPAPEVDRETLEYIHTGCNHAFLAEPPKLSVRPGSARHFHPQPVVQFHQLPEEIFPDFSVGLYLHLQLCKRHAELLICAHRHLP